MAQWTTEVRSDRAVFDELAVWWDTQPPTINNPFMRSSVLAGWEDAFGPAGSQRRVHILLRDGDLVAALPLSKVGRKFISMSRGMTAGWDVITGSDPEVLDYLPRWLGSFDYLRLDPLAWDSPITGMLPHTRWDVLRVWPSAYMDLRGGVDATLQRIDPKIRKEIAGKQRSMGRRVGEVTFIETPISGGSDPTLDAGFHLEMLGWKGAQGRAVLQRPAFEQWIRHIADTAGPEGWMRASQLFVADRLVAFVLDVIGRDTRHLILTHYDPSPDVRGFSPGRILMQEVIAAAASQGNREYAFGIGDDEWKAELATGIRGQKDIRVFGDGLVGRALRAAVRLRRQVSK